mgnify:CR=1 FL=1
MQTKRFLVLLVVLALSSLLLSGIADSAVRTMVPEGSDGVPGGVVLKDGGGADGGDDDRWGDTSPTIPTEEGIVPEMGKAGPGGNPNGAMMMFTTGELWSLQVRCLFSAMLTRF